MKYDLKDVTFIIPLQIDSISRLENLFLTIDFLQANFECKICILEAGRYSNGIVEKCMHNTDYCFIEDKDTVFHRTKYLNMLSHKVITPYLGIWDSDIIIPIKQIIDSINKLRSGAFHVAYPYDGRFLETSFLLRRHYIENKTLSFLTRNQDKMKLLHTAYKGVGGAIFVNKEKYFEAGLENEHFYGWGAEDDERLARWEILGYRIHRSKGVLYHLTHTRSVNSAYISQSHKSQAYSELFSTKVSTKTEIETKVKEEYFSSRSE